MIEIRLSGPIQILEDGSPLQGFRSQKGLALLAYLALEARPVARNQLAALFWGRLDETQARRELRRVLYDLKSRLAHCIEANRQSARFHLEAARVDVVAFERLVAQNDLEALAKAAALYRGELLEGINLEDSAPFEEWLLLQRERWRRRVTGVLRRLVALHNGRRDYEIALRFARRLLDLDAWREDVHRQVMALLALQGRRADALRQYEVCQRTLRRELGVEPTTRTTVLYRRIRATGKPYLHNLPPQPTPFIGREDELLRLVRLLTGERVRLITVGGPGGSGKTRLALQAATASLDSFFDGVILVPLAAVPTSARLAGTIVDVLASVGAIAPLQGEETPAAHLLAQLQDRKLLLLLDNFEHLLSGGLSLLLSLLENAPGVSLLITSRTFLNLSWEHRFELQGLPYPAPTVARGWEEYASARLFLESARRVRPDFSPTADDRAAILRICSLVSGMPLALELAAAWVRVRSPATIARQIEHNLDFLSGAQRGLPPRHASVRATFDHSWNLLSPAEQRPFSRLGVFHDGFDMEAARVVAGADERTLSALLDKSLLHRREPLPGRAHTPLRYGMHTLLHRYVVEQLARAGDAAELQAAHGRYFAAFLRQRGQELRGGPQREAWQAIEQEMDNALAAWRWAVALGPADAVEEALPGFFRYHYMRNRYRQGAERLRPADAVLQKRGQPLARARGRLLACLAAFSSRMGDREKAQLLAENSLELARRLDDREGEALALQQLGRIAYNQGRYREAEQLTGESLALYRELDHPDGQADCNTVLGVTAAVQAKYRQKPEGHARRSQIRIEKLATAREHLHAALAHYEAIEDRWSESIVRHNLGYLAYVHGEGSGDESSFQEAKDFFLQAVAIDQALELPAPQRLNWLACSLAMLEEKREAHRAFYEALDRAVSAHAWREVADIVGNVSLFVFLQEGKESEAAELLTLVAACPATDARIRSWARGQLADLDLPAPPIPCGSIADLRNAARRLLAGRELSSG